MKSWLRKFRDTLVGISLFAFLLLLYNYEEALHALEGLYLHHLTVKEKAAEKAENEAEKKAIEISKQEPSSEGPCKIEEASREETIESVERKINSWSACNQKLVDKFWDDVKKAMHERWDIHEKRLRLEVKWGTVSLPEGAEDAKELGWNYPRPLWDGHNWSCPPGSSPYSIQAEKEAGAHEYVHCLTEKQAAEWSPAESAAEKQQRQATEDAQAAETKRVLSKCYALPDQELVPDHPLGRLREACVSLVVDQRIVKPTDICHQLGSAENFDSCMSGFKTDGATDACALMIRDPDLAPACKDVKQLPEKSSSESNHLPQTH